MQFELVMDRGVPITTAHRWLETLKQVSPAGVRIAAARGRVAPSVERIVADQYRVTGVITSRSELQLPGGRFSVRDVQRLREWIAQIDRWVDKPPADSGADGGAGRGADGPWGLSADQFAALRRHMATAVTKTTAGRPSVDVMAELRRQITVPITTVGDVDAALEQAPPVHDELQGVACGTALAALLRPAGLICVPQLDQQGQVHLAVTRFDPASRPWPVGWPSDKPDGKLVPKLTDRLEVDIEPLPVRTVVDALRQRLELAAIWNQNDMARRRIDPAVDEVSHPPASRLYSSVLSHVLYQAQLRYELRLDDAGRPLLWITPLRDAADNDR